MWLKTTSNKGLVNFRLIVLREENAYVIFKCSKDDNDMPRFQSPQKINRMKSRSLCSPIVSPSEHESFKSQSKFQVLETMAKARTVI